MKRETIMRWHKCDIAFTITAKGESLRCFSPGCKALTRDVLCDDYPNIEVRRAGSGWYICQYRTSKRIAVQIGCGCSMQEAVASGLGNVRRSGWSAKTLRAKALDAARKEPEPEPEPEPETLETMIDRHFA